MEMTDILYAWEDTLLEELEDLVAIKKNGGKLSEQDICNGKHITSSIESIERTIMIANVDPEEYEYGNDSNMMPNTYSRNNGYNRSSREAHYGNNYSRSNSYARRYGHDENEFRAEVERRMNMARNDNERAVYANWLNEMDNHRH